MSPGGVRTLRDEERSAFHALGWLRCDDVLACSVDELRTEVARIGSWGDDGEWLQHYELTDSGRTLARTENFTPFSDLLRELLTEGAVPGIAGQLLGEEAVLYKEKINYKAPGGAGFSPHQDKPAYPFVDAVLSVMIAVDDATVDNGCLFVVDGGHGALLEQDHRGCIAPAVVESLDWHPVELPAGATLFFHALTPHRSGPNATREPRRALYPTYNGASEGMLRDAYYAEKRRVLASAGDDDRVHLSLIGDFEGRPA